MSKIKRMLDRLYQRRPDLLSKEIESQGKAEFEKHENKVKTLKKAQSYSYAGPMSVADINIASWNEFFAEGGMLNQPTWLQKPRLNAIRKKFEFLSRYHK
jgi:hypothetical protein